MKCYIIGSVKTKIYIDKGKDDLIIAADGGYNEALKNNINVDLLIGDLDSINEIPDNIETIKLNKEKDETDTYISIEEAIKRGYNDITLYGCLGGRIEHTIANIQILAKYTKDNIKIKMLSENQNIYILKENDQKVIDKNLKYISLFSYSTNAIVSLDGFKYNGDNIELTNTFPLGIDNETTNRKGTIKIKKGIVLVIETE